MKSKCLLVGVASVCFFLGSGVYNDSFAQGWKSVRGGNNSPKLEHGAAFILLPSGKVLIFRGSSGVLFDPYKNTDNNAENISKPNIPRLCSMPVLWNGKVCFVGGREDDGKKDGQSKWNILNSTECYNPEGDSWEKYPMLEKRWYPGAISLLDGRILIMGGLTDSGDTSTCEIFDPTGTSENTNTGNMLSDSLFPSATLMKNGEVFAESKGVFQIYDPYSGELGQWSSIIPLLSLNHANFMVFSDGNVFIIGGENQRKTSKTCSIYNPSTKGLYPAASLNNPRYSAHSVWLPTGEIFIVGGESRRIKLKSCELFSDGKWWSNLPKAPFLVGHHGAAVLLTDGSVLVANDNGRMAVYEPWYFSQERPVIVNKEAEVLQRGERFQLEVKSKSPIERVCLIAVDAVTHHNNSGGNRYLLPGFSIESSTADSANLLVDLPEELPPHSSWLAFVLDENNIPSEAKILTSVGDN